MKLQTRIFRFFATLGPIGSLPYSGTMGTICAVPLLFVLRHLMVQFGLFEERIVLAGLFLLGVWIVDRALPATVGRDPSNIILDEVIGFFITMVGLPLHNPLILFMGFALFRFFDIVKPLGIDRIESIDGAWGIMLDDVVAAIFAHIVLVFSLNFLP